MIAEQQIDNRLRAPVDMIPLPVADIRSPVCLERRTTKKAADALLRAFTTLRSRNMMFPEGSACGGVSPPDETVPSASPKAA